MTLSETGMAHNIVAGRVGRQDIVLVRTGMGPQNARLNAALVLGEAAGSKCEIGNASDLALGGPAAVLVFGLAGSLSSSVAESELVLYESCLSTREQAAERCSPYLTRRLARMLNDAGTPCRQVKGISASRVASTSAEKRSLAASGAEAVDMESYEIVAEANRRAVPAVVLRAVSDSFEREMPDFNRAFNSEGGFDGLALARVCAARPLAAAALAATSWSAMRRLNKAIDIIFTAGFPDARDVARAAF